MARKFWHRLWSPHDFRPMGHPHQHYSDWFPEHFLEYQKQVLLQPTFKHHLASSSPSPYQQISANETYYDYLLKLFGTIPTIPLTYYHYFNHPTYFLIFLNFQEVPCWHWQSGWCKMGPKCTYAHGTEDLRGGAREARDQREGGTGTAHGAQRGYGYGKGGRYGSRAQEWDRNWERKKVFGWWGSDIAYFLVSFGRRDWSIWDFWWCWLL